MAKIYETACAAIDRGNYDYAVKLLSDVLKMQPSHADARKRLRETVVRKQQQSGKSASSATVWLVCLPSIIKILIAQVSKKFDKVLMESESVLLKDPRNKLVLSWLASAAVQLEMNPVAIDTYEWLHQIDQKDAKIIFHLSQLYSMERDIPKATEYLELYRRMVPGDREADRLLRNLAAEQTIDRGYGKEAKTGTSRELVMDKEATDRLQEEGRIVRTQDDMDRAMSRSLKDVELDPKNRKALGSLAALYRRSKRYEEALQVYQKLLALDPNNIEVQDAIGDIHREQMLAEIERLEAAAGEPNAPADLAQQVQAKKKAADEHWGQELDRRVKARPTELTMRHIYGSYLFTRGQWDAALVQFQHSRRDPRHRRDACNKLGQCFFRKRMYDVAEKQYASAFEGVQIVDEEAKDVLYNWALAAEAAGHKDDYEDKIRRIYENDVSFRDIGHRMEALYKQAQEGK